MTIDETIPEMSPAMQSPYEAVSDATSMPMNNSIDAEVVTTNSTFKRVWELLERRRRRRRGQNKYQELRTGHRCCEHDE
ncbi:hypothetical protein E4U60_006911, partial [Claviceps pazoutovae]